MGDLNIVYMSPNELQHYSGNARKHEQKDLDTIRASIEEFGFLDPIGIWGQTTSLLKGMADNRLRCKWDLKKCLV